MTGSAGSNSWPGDNPEGRAFGANIVGYLFGHAQLTNTRVLALVGDPDARAYELLSYSAEKKAFLNLVRSNEDMGNDYISLAPIPRLVQK